MKKDRAFQFSVCVARHSTMFAVMCLLLSAPGLRGAELSCTDRILDLATPKLPENTSALHAITKGACSVDVVFSLSTKGVATVIGAGSSEKRCKVLEGSAKSAVASSKFSAGERIDNCTIRITFDTEEMVPVAMWRSSAETTDGGYGREHDAGASIVRWDQSR